MAYDILVVDDEPGLREMVQGILAGAGYTVRLAGTCAQALQQSRAKLPDGVLLDVMLPDGDGFALLGQLRDLADLPVLFLSARDEDADRLRGLGLGADDYITKPFSVSELIARVEALARRVRRSATADDEQAGSEPDQLVSGPFVLDEKSRVLYKSGKPIDLTQVEFQIMELFFRNPATALVREKILEGVWGKNYFGDVKIVDVNIRRLRMKIEDEPSNPRHIMTVWGYGYRWNV